MSTNTINGLSGQTITALYHSDTFNKTIVGYENGLLILIDETDSKIYKFVDIINKQLPPNIKRINHFFEYNNIAYLSCDFGIVQFNIVKQLFGETYFIGTSPSDIKVNQTTVFNGKIYAATQNFGLKSANVTNPNLIDATQWTTVLNGNFQGVASLPNILICAEISGQNYKSIDGNTFTNITPTLSPAAKSIRVNENQFVITSPNQVDRKSVV